MDFKRDVNFIPNEHKEQKSHLLTTIIFYMLMIGIFITIAGIVAPNLYLLSKKEERSALASRESQYRMQALEYDELSLKNTYLSEKLNSLRTLDESRISVMDLIDDLEKALPKNVTISNLSISMTEISFNSTAPDNETVAEFYNNLLNVKYFSKVVLNNVETSEDRTRLEFPIRIILDFDEGDSEEGSANETD